jgi:hypothetical protein
MRDKNKQSPALTQTNKKPKRKESCQLNKTKKANFLDSKILRIMINFWNYTTKTLFFVTKFNF